MTDFQIEVILVETMGSANIGSVARSCTAYGLSGFRLVTPRCEVDEETLKWACYGNRILDGVKTFGSLEEALEDLDLAVALSRRDGKNRHRHISLPSFTQVVVPEQASGSRIALVFGNEESGLSREHLKLCHYSADIPVVASDGSLNLAHAVTTTLYEVIGRAGVYRETKPKTEHEELADSKQLAGLLKRAEETLEKVGYPHHRSTLEEEIVKLQSIAARAKLEKWEVRLLLGMLKQLNYRLDNPE